MPSHFPPCQCRMRRIVLSRSRVRHARVTNRRRADSSRRVVCFSQRRLRWVRESRSALYRNAHECARTECAQPSGIRRMVLGEGGQLALIGLAIGLFGAVLAGQLLGKLWFGVNQYDVPTQRAGEPQRTAGNARVKSNCSPLRLCVSSASSASSFCF